MGPLTGGDPRRVGPYTTIGRLGAGALGPVYVGQADDGKVAAVRVLSPELLADEEVRAKLAADLAAARTVSGPYAVPVLDLDLDSDIPWTASALVAGIPLARAVAEHGPLPDPALLTLAGGIAEALVAVHAAGVMHGDLRPGTVLLTADGPRVVDYALARAFQGAADLGVPGYQAPEQAQGRAVTSSADLFALGSTLFYAATGRAPFGEGTLKEMRLRVAKSSPVLGKLPEVLKELIRGCLQKDANGRAQPQQVLEYVQKRGATAWGRAWLPPGVAADVRAAVAETPGGGGLGTVVGVPAVGVVQLETNPAEHATVVAAVVTPVAPETPQQSDVGVPFGAAPGFAPAPGMAGMPGNQTAPQAPPPLPSPSQPQPQSPPQAMPPPMPQSPPQATPQSLPQPQPPGSAAPPFGPAQPLSGAAMPSPAATPATPSRRNLLLALTGGAAVVVGAGAAFVGLGGSSGTTPAAAAKPPTSPGSGAGVGAAPPTTAPSSTAAGLPAPSSSAVPSGAGTRHPLPPTGALPPPTGAAGRLQGPAVTPFWELPVTGGISSMAAGEGTLVVSGDQGVSGYDLGGNPLWGPVQAVGAPGSGNGVVASGAVYLIAGSSVGGGDLLALDLRTGAQKWRTPLPAGSQLGARVGGVLNGTVFVIGTSGAAPYLWAVDATRGTTRWQKTGVQFATLAVPSDGRQIVAAGVTGPDTAGTVGALDIGTGDPVWSQPLKSWVDYSRPSVSRATFDGAMYVSLLVDAQDGGTLVGGTTDGGQTRWSTPLTPPAGDTGPLARITRSPDGTAVVAVSRHGVYAADPRTGRILWQSQGTESFDTASDTGAPQIVDGIVYLHDQKGSWWTVDLATGRTRWQYAVPGFDGATEPVWVAASGGVVLFTGGKLALVAAHG
jgi:outer membrane protein assembly factor BamB